MQARIRQALVSGALVVTLCALGSQLGDARAWAAGTSDGGAQVSENGFIRVTSLPTTGMDDLQVGVPADWQISVEPLVPGTGTLRIGFALTSNVLGASGLDVEVLACDVKWINGACSGKKTVWQNSAPVSAAFASLDLEGLAHEVGSIPIKPVLSPTWLVLRIVPVELSKPVLATFMIVVAGQGVPISLGQDPSARLARSGVDLSIILWMIVPMMGGIWFIVLGRAGRRTRRNRRGSKVVVREWER
ncbi:MAG TPA: hypothetical protein VK139_06335 [Microbacteriaceae bacterium]|nr:hypothetical protein [Microbacteriaceae bacterium]